jgi:hypothetical protein
MMKKREPSQLAVLAMVRLVKVDELFRINFKNTNPDG